MRKPFTPTQMAAVIMTCLILTSLIACEMIVRDAILIQPGDPVTLRETVPSVKVWVADEDGTLKAAVADLPKGCEVRVLNIRPGAEINLSGKESPDMK